MQKAKSFLLKNTSYKSTQILIPNQLVVDTIFALNFRNWLIIIILAFVKPSDYRAKKSFFFSFKVSIFNPTAK
jgi:hypothetical protein